MFGFSEKLLGDVQVITPKVFRDERGLFTKTFHRPLFLEKHLDFRIKECFFTVSKKDVIRGMHFQIPPKDHNKLVYVPKGDVKDIILDIRRHSATYGQHVSVNLNEENGKMVYIPKGFAHGFAAMSDEAMVAYMVDQEHAPACDQGIRWDSFGAAWDIGSPIISAKDQQWPKLNDFHSPFSY